MEGKLSVKLIQWRNFSQLAKRTFTWTFSQKSFAGRKFRCFDLPGSWNYQIITLPWWTWRRTFSTISIPQSCSEWRLPEQNWRKPTVAGWNPSNLGWRKRRFQEKHRQRNQWREAIGDFGSSRSKFERPRNIRFTEVGEMVDNWLWFSIRCNSNIDVIDDEEEAHSGGLEKGGGDNGCGEGWIGIFTDEFGDNGADREDEEEREWLRLEDFMEKRNIR